jgi:hypothetical protein
MYSGKNWSSRNRGKSTSLPYDRPPGQRSPLRLTLGRIYHTWRRKLKWIASGAQYVHDTTPSSKLPYLACTHKTFIKKTTPGRHATAIQRNYQSSLGGTDHERTDIKTGRSFFILETGRQTHQAQGILEGHGTVQRQLLPGNRRGIVPA